MNEDDLKFIIENQQKEMRAFDQKAGHYIASNAAVFVIAIFTLCVFNLLHDEKSSFCLASGQGHTPQWILLLALMIVYILLFTASTICCLLVLYPRFNKKNANYEYAPHSITSSNSGGVEELTVRNQTQFFISNKINVLLDHIRSNKVILKAKNKFSKPILVLSILMCAVLLALVVCLFCI